jgi:nucleoside-diphosphate-sugar epimerase
MGLHTAKCLMWVRVGLSEDVWMRALVTGGTGFIGIHLIAELAARGWPVRCLVRETSDRRPLAPYEVEYVVGSLSNRDTLQHAVQDVTHLFHLAGVTKARVMADYDRINHGGTQALLEACLKSYPTLQAFVYISSIAASGPSVSGQPVTETQIPQPVGPYGLSKLGAEKAVLATRDQLPVIVLRPSAIYGPHDKDFLPLFRAVKRGWLPVIGRETLHVDVCFVKDLVHGMLAAATCPDALGGTFFLGGATHTWREIGDEIARQFGRPAPRDLRLPRRLVLTAATFAEGWAQMTGRPGGLNRQSLIERLQPYWVFDSSKARQVFGYQPQVALPQGLAHTLQWYRERGQI